MEGGGERKIGRQEKEIYAASVGKWVSRHPQWPFSIFWESSDGKDSDGRTQAGGGMFGWRCLHVPNAGTFMPVSCTGPNLQIIAVHDGLPSRVSCRESLQQALLMAWHSHPLTGTEDQHELTLFVYFCLASEQSWGCSVVLNCSSHADTWECPSVKDVSLLSDHWSELRGHRIFRPFSLLWPVGWMGREIFRRSTSNTIISSTYLTSLLESGGFNTEVFHLPHLLFRWGWSDLVSSLCVACFLSTLLSWGNEWWLKCF